MLPVSMSTGAFCQSRYHKNKHIKKVKREEYISAVVTSSSASGGIQVQAPQRILKSLSLHVGEFYTLCNREIKIVPPPPQRVLTQPSDSSPTNPCDNHDGNLICRVYDKIESNIYSYCVLDLLGTGTFGQVFKCKREGSEELVAVKIVKGKPAYRKQGLLEIRIVSALNAMGNAEDRANIVNMLDSFEYKGHICIVFELLGISILDLLAQNQYRGLPMNVVRQYTRQILSAMLLLQDANIIHCDLKPENILLWSHENSEENTSLSPPKAGNNKRQI